MSHRVFVTVKRGPMDSTAVCVFPWEKDILSRIHKQAVDEKSIDELVSLKEAAKVERQPLAIAKKHKLKAGYAPDLREQFLLMAYVDPELDPCLDPETEYGRMIEKYGMDAEVAIPVVERVFGSPASFATFIKQFANKRIPKPDIVQMVESDIGKPIDKMTVSDVRAELDRRGIAWAPSEKLDALRKKLGEALESEAT